VNEDTIHEAYREARERLTAWARTLSDDQAAIPVPALPGWTVKDTFSHLAGNVADALDGRLTAPPSDEATAQQVAPRSERSLDEVLDEWDERGPQFEALLSDLGAQAPRAVVLDVWTHEIDLRSAVGEPIPDGGASERILATIVRRGIGRSWNAAGVPPLRIVCEDEAWVVGGDEPVGTLRTTTFELGRVMLGRRSPGQMAALAWEGDDPSVWIGALPVFGPAETDVVDSPRA
jgi:uncharacterized protein (TIGR03083 family)